MSVTFTGEQKLAIKKRGKIIVSASAGSGKTATMIERLVNLILSGVDVRNVLAVTFTNKAAAQMREKLRSALIERISRCEGAERVRLKEQLVALPLADISTIHAFCARLLRTYFYFANVEPAFRIISPDDAEGKAISSRALDEAFDSEYEEGKEDFYRLLSVYFRKKKDARLRALILELNASVRGLANYREILSRAGEDVFEETCEFLTKEYHKRALLFLRELDKINKEVLNEKAVKVYDGVSVACAQILTATNLFELSILALPEIPSMPPMTKAVGDELRNLKGLSTLSKNVKELYKTVRTYQTKEVEYARFLDGAQRARAIAALELRYDEIYTRLKEERGVLDYNDLEHRALAVLQTEEARKSLREKYQYIFVDEYQDVNPVQETLLSFLEGEETFLVGDSKQAIYGFRGSKSTFFTQKGKTYPNRLWLTQNFRSSPAVLDVVNLTFASLLQNYPLMKGGERYGEARGDVECHLLPQQEEGEKTLLGIYSVLTGKERGEQEDALTQEVVRLVLEECGEQGTGKREWLDADTGEKKLVQFGDIAVLTRKNTGDAERISRALTKCGIPVVSSSKVNVCDFFEARLLIDWLSLLDNEEQDIPYVSALLSAIGNMNERELAAVRVEFPVAYTFRKACRLYREKKGDEIAQKLNVFAREVEKYRALSRVRTAAEMMNLLLSDGLEAQISALKEGKTRLLRVRRLLAEAEKTGGDVGEFLLSLKMRDYRVDFMESAGENAVKVLTMHASKGLEYPVVILAGLDAPFHGAEKDELMWTERFLLAPKSFDLDKKSTSETVLRRASALWQQREDVEQELNLLYVAMTRARYRLHMLFSGKEQTDLPAYAGRFSSFFDLEKLAPYFVEADKASGEFLPRSALPSHVDAREKEEILAVYRQKYPFESATRLPSKSSASELMAERNRLSTVEFTGDEGATTQEGLAYHAFLEHVRFGEDAESELARMRREGLLNEDQLALLRLDNLRAILQIPCLKGLKDKRIWREQTFLVSIPAKELWQGEESEDEILLQGAIDLLCEDDEGFFILDYKYSAKDEKALREHYALQIALYRKAVARVMRVKEERVRACIVNIKKCFEVIL